MNQFNHLMNQVLAYLLDLMNWNICCGLLLQPLNLNQRSSTRELETISLHISFSTYKIFFFRTTLVKYSAVLPGSYPSIMDSSIGEYLSIYYVDDKYPSHWSGSISYLVFLPRFLLLFLHLSASTLTQNSSSQRLLHLCLFPALNAPFTIPFHLHVKIRSPGTCSSNESPKPVLGRSTRQSGSKKLGEAVD